MCIPTYKDGDILENLKGLFYKDNIGDGAYSYAGLYYENFNDKSDKKYYSEDFYNQVKSYVENGFDGIKILEGKPTERQKIKVMLSDEVFDKAFTYLEENQIPITIHNADPATFWHLDQIPESQRKWYVGDDMPSKDELFNDIIAILDKHPNLRITLAHFGFTTDNIKQARQFLSYKKTMLDVCPGYEQYVNITNDYFTWRDFIIKNIDRFTFGTDIANLPHDNDWAKDFVLNRYNFLTRFFETVDDYEIDFGKVKGIGLTKDEQYKLYYGNAYRELGEPKPINYGWVMEEIAKVKKAKLSDKQAYELSVIEEYFSKK